MAEITTATTGNRKAGVRQSKKHSTRVDLTPMVDLGFLLITFFIFSTSLSKPKAMDLKMPADGPNGTAGETASLTVLLMEEDQVFYYHGMLKDALAKGQYGITNYNVKSGIGQVIRDKQAAMDRVKPDNRKELIFMIKSTPGATYQNIVDILDEVLINMVSRYVIMDITDEENTALTNHPSHP